MIKEVGLTLITAATFQIFATVNDFHKDLPQPVQVKEDIVRTKARYALEELKAPPDRMNRLVNAVHAGHIASNGIDPILIVSLMYTESAFKITAKSNKGYKGLMQTPKAEMKINMEAVDVVRGCSILNEKLHTKYASGNMIKALQLYKGGANNEALQYAKETYTLYNRISSKFPT